MLHFLIYDVLGTPAILVGLFSLIGLLLQKKGISDVISGTLKTIMGFVILTAGAGIIAYTLTIFSQLFEHSFHIQGVVPNTDAMAALAQKNYGTETATIMVLGMLINIALARLTRTAKSGVVAGRTPAVGGDIAGQPRAAGGTGSRALQHVSGS